MKTKLSRFTISAFTILAAIGFGYGVFLNAHRPDSYPPNVFANNAIAVHIVLAVLALFTAILIQVLRSRRNVPNIWLALFSERAVNRLRRTILPQQKNVFTIGRAFLCLIPLYIILWTPFRSAMQIIAALDPSITANAWGGPSYWGATLAHWLDGAILMYIGALILNLLMERHVPKQ